MWAKEANVIGWVTDMNNEAIILPESLEEIGLLVQLWI